MNYLLFYYLISRVIMVFVLAMGYAAMTRKTNETISAYSRINFIFLIPIMGEVAFLQLLISALSSLL